MCCIRKHVIFAAEVILIILPACACCAPLHLKSAENYVLLQTCLSGVTPARCVKGNLRRNSRTKFSGHPLENGFVVILCPCLSIWAFPITSWVSSFCMALLHPRHQGYLGADSTAGHTLCHSTADTHTQTSCLKSVSPRRETSGLLHLCIEHVD